MMTNMKHIHSAKSLAFLVLSAILIALLMPTFVGIGYLNLGFIFLNKTAANNSEPQRYQAAHKSERFFVVSSSFTKSEKHANIGLGFTAWHLGDTIKAAKHWRDGQIPIEEVLIFGDLANERGDREEALSWYKTAASINLAAAASSLGRQFHDLGQFDNAVKLWQGALAAYPEDPQRLNWWIGLSRSLRRNENFHEAEEVIRIALVEFPNDTQLLTNLGSTLIGLDADFESTATVLRQAIAFDEDNAEAYGVMAQLLSRENQYEEALTYFDKAIERDQSVKWWHVARANMARRLGKLEEAKVYLLQAINLFPTYAPAYYELAGVYQLSNDPLLAQQAIEQAVSLQKPSPLNYYVRAGDIYAWNNEFDQARSAYERAAEIAPDDPRVIEGLASLRESE
ncbi:MAG: tetratricopeptide repeat protein [Anaerolineales bacterium]|jgi:tetratricopeptide (TPR) repeat protein